MKAMHMLPDEKLIIVGSYEKGAAQFETYVKKILAMKPDNVEIRHWLDDTELRKLYAECKGVISTAKDEDFGMSVVEGMACGKPVIASNEGGYRESIIHGQAAGNTGILVDFVETEHTDAEVDANADLLADAIRTMSLELAANPDRYRDDCIARAREFDVGVFIQKIKNLINEYEKANAGKKRI
jgi:glycosyltransferase involved in cell wall biosynthesis